MLRVGPGRYSGTVLEVLYCTGGVLAGWTGWRRGNPKNLAFAA